PLLFGADAAELAGDLPGGRRVDVEKEIADGGDDERADPAAGHADRTETSTILDIAAAPSALPPHGSSPSRPKLCRNAAGAEGMRKPQSGARSSQASI